MTAYEFQTIVFYILFGFLGFIAGIVFSIISYARFIYENPQKLEDFLTHAKQRKALIENHLVAISNKKTGDKENA